MESFRGFMTVCGLGSLLGVECCVRGCINEEVSFFNERLGSLIRNAVHKSPVTWIFRIDVD